MADKFDPQEWLTTKEAASLTGYNVRYLRQLINEGKVTSVKRGGVFWLEERSIKAYAEEMKRLGPAKHDPWRNGSRQSAGKRP